MIDLYKIGNNPYLDEAISLDELLTFSEAHLAAVTADAVAAQVAFELTAVGNALNALDASAASETVKLGLQKARVVAKANFRATLPNEVSRIYGAALEAFGQQGAEVNEVFPEGRDVFSKCKDALLKAKLVALSTAVQGQSAVLGAAMVTLAGTLVASWQTVYQAAVDAKGMHGGGATDRRAAGAALKMALALLRLELGKQLLGQYGRLISLFPQYLLGFPMEESVTDETPEPEPEPLPEQAVITELIPPAGELGNVVYFTAVGATSFRVYLRQLGEAEFSLVGEPVAVEGAGQQELPPLSSDEHTVKVSGVNATGEGPESAEFTFFGGA